MAQDGKVVINIDSNASKVARDFQNLSNDTAKYERILQNVAGTSNATLPIYDKIRSKLKEQQSAVNSAITSYQKLANAQKSGIGFSQLNSVTGSAIERLRNLALQGRQNSAEFQKLAKSVKEAYAQLNQAQNAVNNAISDKPVQKVTLLTSNFYKLKKSISDFENTGDVFSKIDERLSKLQNGSNSVQTGFKALSKTNISINSETAQRKLQVLRQETTRAITAFEQLTNASKSLTTFGNLSSQTNLFTERLRTLALRGQANSVEFKRMAEAVKNANKQLNSAENIVNKAIGNTSGLSGALGTLGGSLGSLGGLAAGAAAGFAAMKLKEYGQYALSTSAAFEQLAISFRVMTGSAQTGQELTDAIIELGAKTPMTAQQLSKAAQLLLSFGESAENIIPDLKLLGDITGGEVNRFNQLSLAFAQVGANGRLMGQDLLQMVNAGFNPLQIMSQTTGKSMGQLREEMSEGRISFQMVAQAMRAAASEGGRYFGLMEQQSQSLNGLLSTMGDTWEQVAKNIGDLFLPIAKGAVKALINIGQSAQWVTGKLKEMIESMNYGSINSQANILAEMRNRRSQYEQMLTKAQSNGNKSQVIFITNQIKQLDAAIERTAPKLKKLVDEQRQSVKSNIGSRGFNATVLSSGDDKKGRQKRQLTISEQLQKSYNEEYRRLQDLAVQGVTSGKVWDSQVAKVNNLSNALERMKQVTDLTVVPPFQALNTEIQKAQERVNNLAASKIVNLNELKQAKTELTTLQKKLYDVQQAATTSPYQQKQNQISYLQSQLQDMAISGQAGSAGFNALKNQLKQAQSEITKANAAVQNSVGLTWSSISGTISSQLSYALTTPLQEGENAFERFGNVALNVIGQIAQAWLSSKLTNLFNGSGSGGGSGILGKIGGAVGSFWGPIGSAVGGFLGNTVGKFFNANGNAFSHGRVLPFANGGVVSSPTMFPMSGNRTGIMGEKGAEAIMPLKRAANGQLGVQAQTAPATVNIYNQSDSRIETVQRPDGETDIFIRRVNNALRNERTQAGFSSALQRNQSRGVQAS